VLVLNTSEVKPCVDKNASVSGRLEGRQERRHELPPPRCGWKPFFDLKLHEAAPAAALPLDIRGGVPVNVGRPGWSSELVSA
jgi:hypothetical protein